MLIEHKGGRRHSLAAVAIALVAGGLTGGLPELPAPELGHVRSCPTAVDAASFATTARFEQRVSRIADFGLRMPASREHDNMLDWLDDELTGIPGLQVRSDPYRMTRWLPTTASRELPGLDLGRAGSLTVQRKGKDRRIPTAGALAYSKPTRARGVAGKVVYLPEGTAITPENSQGKIVLRDVPSAPLPYAALVALSHYVSPDLLEKATGSYDRPYLTTGLDVEADQTRAAQVGAIGIIHSFNVPSRQVRGYFDPHTGTLQHIPGVWVGVEQREQLKRSAQRGQLVRIAVHAKIDQRVPTRNIVASLPGQSSEKISLVTNTDGNTWVQENSPAALLALAEYFAALPLTCRPKTIEFAFTSAHLAYAWDGVPRYVNSLEKDGAETSFVFVVEHLGTREILPVDRTNGPGQRLVFTGEPEPYAWFAPTESSALSSALAAAVSGRGTTGSAVLRGLDLPSPGRLPTSCNFGGLANFSHQAFIPTVGGISGPWSLWAPAFGRRAVDFERMREQSLSVGDTILALDDLDATVVDGLYPTEKALVAGGAPTCPPISPAKVAPR
jgi:hypothetical protein